MYFYTMILVMTALMITTEQKSIHDFQIQALNSEETIDFEQFAGKKILVVNVASKCGFTRQYEGLEALHKKYGDQLVVIGFPCNQFKGQEPGTEAEIATFCSSTYGVTFPLTTKIDVKGEGAHEIYQWLTQKSLNGKGDYEIGWNFNKFLLDEEGQIIAHFASNVEPMDEQIVSYLN